jgi:hypothetical protein
MTIYNTDIVHQIQHEFDDLLNFVLLDTRSSQAYEVERTIWHRLLQIGYVLMKAWFQMRCQQYGQTPLVGDDGEETPFLTEKTRTFYSIFGKFKFTRPYFYRRGQGGALPLDELLGLGDDIYSDMLRQMHGLLAVHTTYDKSVSLMDRFLGNKLSTRVAQQFVSKDAVDVAAYYDKQVPPPVENEAEILVVQADGKGVPLVQDEFAGGPKIQKKEAVVTSVYTIAARPRTPKDVLSSYFDKVSTGEPKERNRPQNKKLWATLKGKDTAFQRLRRQVDKRDGSHFQHRVALCDGDEALQNRFEGYFDTFTLILDFIHADEYLWDAAKTLFAEAGPLRTGWVRQQATLMLTSQTKQLITALRHQADAPETTAVAQEVLHKVANYFERNQTRMDYKTYLANGWPIASGVIEGACRHLVKDRMECSGMHWNQPTAEAMLALRAVAENDDWDEYHAFRRQRRQRRLYYPESPEAFVPTVYHQLPLAI